MTTITNEIIKQKKRLAFVYQKAEEGCKLFNEEMLAEAEITFTEAMEYSEELVEKHPNEFSYRVLLAETHHILSLAFSNIEEYDKAHIHLTEAFNIYQGIHRSDFLYEQILNSSMARIENAEGHYRNASKILEKIIHDIEVHPEEGLSKDGYLYCSDLLLLAQIYLDNGQYKKAVETTRSIISLKKTRSASMLNQHPQDLIDFLNIMSHQAMENEDEDFQRFVLEEGIAACQQAEAAGMEVDLLCYGTFYQDLLKQLFFSDDKEYMRKRYEELIAFCDRYINMEHGLLKYKIAGRLNYAVYCGKVGDYQDTEEMVCEAISECTVLVDDEGPILTLFMVSALNILSNLQWVQGESRGALRDLSSESKILGDFLESHPDMDASLRPLFIELMLNQVRLHYELGEIEKGEAIIDDIRGRFNIHEEEYQETVVGPYVLFMMKVAELHWSMKETEKARREYEELLYIMKEVETRFPKMVKLTRSIEDEIRSILSGESDNDTHSDSLNR